MNIQLSSFIDRLLKMTQQPTMRKSASNIEESESNQYGAINNNLLNNNDLETSIEVMGLHLYSAGSVIMLILILFAAILLWRCCKRKNRHKIAKFICIPRCRYSEDMEDNPEKAMSYNKKTGARVENIPLDVNGLVSLSNQLAMNQAFTQVQSQSRSASTNNLTAEAAIEAPTSI